MLIIKYALIITIIILIAGGGFIAGPLYTVLWYGPTIPSADLRKASERAPELIMAVWQSGADYSDPLAYGRVRALTKQLVAMDADQARAYFERVAGVDPAVQQANIDDNIAAHKRWEALPWWRRAVTREPEWHLLDVQSATTVNGGSG